MLHHEVEVWVDRLVDKVEELENQQAELVDELVIKMVKEETEQLQNLLPTIIAQVGNHASNIQGDVRNVSMNNGRGGCSYKEFLACNPKEYDGNGGVIVYTRWTEKMESVHNMSGCGYNQKVKYTSGSFIGKALTWWNTQLDRLVPHLVTPKNKKIERCIYGLALHIRGMVAANEPTTIYSAILKARVLTDEAIKNGSLRKNTEKRGNGGESSRDGNVKDDNKRSKTMRAFATTTNPVRTGRAFTIATLRIIHSKSFQDFIHVSTLT
ncbi:hypothetical protein Tco_1081613 [Tanacetum coccineum]|uniref:Reverse transcriptase domain-containing protein n=1 Tax=Tanacetum coccineum TaxID=301880 RepID=A0ABQ5I023_9ASTR